MYIYKKRNKLLLILLPFSFSSESKRLFVFLCFLSVRLLTMSSIRWHLTYIIHFRNIFSKSFYRISFSGFGLNMRISNYNYFWFFHIWVLFMRTWFVALPYMQLLYNLLYIIAFFWSIFKNIRLPNTRNTIKNFFFF